jgi:hypothetical protein
LVICGGTYAIAQRWGGIAAARLTNPDAVLQFVANYGRLLSGTTIYRFIPGTHFGMFSTIVDSLALAGFAFALLALWRRAGQTGRITDRLLLSGWGCGVVAFFLIAGPEALAPHFERYSVWLIGPSCLLVTLAAAPLLERGALGGRVAQLVGLGLAWCLLIDFNASYFRPFVSTGGESHATFHTAETEPKLAALERVLSSTPNRSGAGPIWIITEEWWNYWPLRYLAMSERGVVVERWSTATTQAGFQESLRLGHVWCVEFAGSPLHVQARNKLSHEGIECDERTIDDPVGRPVLVLMHAQQASALPTN